MLGGRKNMDPSTSEASIRSHLIAGLVVVAVFHTHHKRNKKEIKGLAASHKGLSLLCAAYLRETQRFGRHLEGFVRV